MSWYGRGEEYKEQDWLDRRLKKFLENPLADDIDYTVTFLGSELKPKERSLKNFNNQETRENFVNALEYVSKNYFDDENYFKINGRPLVDVWNASAFIGPFDEALEEVDKISRKEVGHEPFWVLQSLIPRATSRLNKLRDIADGTNAFGPLDYSRRKINEDRVADKEFLKNGIYQLL